MTLQAILKDAGYKQHPNSGIWGLPSNAMYLHFTRNGPSIDIAIYINGMYLEEKDPFDLLELIWEIDHLKLIWPVYYELDDRIE